MTLATVSFETVAEQYQAFFIDQFGVLHDGTAPYPGAIDALMNLMDRGKTVVILSNSGKSGSQNAERLEKLGFPKGCFSHFVTSGDVAANILRDRTQPGMRCFTIARGHDRNLADRLELVPVVDAREAELLIISGSEADTITLETYKALFEPLANLRIPAVCTNPDIEMITSTGLHPAPGALADLYEALGGTVERVGKPFAPMYAYAQRIGKISDIASVVAIGDSIEHDIAGAQRFGMAGVLLRQGVSASLNDTEIAHLVTAHGIEPPLILGGLSV